MLSLAPTACLLLRPTESGLEVRLPGLESSVTLCAPERPVPVLGGVVSGASLAAAAAIAGRQQQLEGHGRDTGGLEGGGCT